MVQKTKLDMTGLHPSATFRGGEGLSEHYINCSNNPYDLRPAADLIISTANKMRANLPEDTPLVILMGEFHKMPSNKELQHMVASRLLDNGDKFTVNFEYPHNYWAEVAQEEMDINVPDGLYYNSSDYDGDGQRTLSTFLGFLGCADAPNSWDNIAAFCYHSKIVSTFNDAANIYENNNSYLNLKDPFTASATHKYNKKLHIADQKIAATKASGMAIRNLIMAQRGLAHAEKNNSQLILQQVGMDHIFGHSRTYSYKNSLCVAYRNAGATVLPVFITYVSDRYGLNIIPKAAYGELTNSVIIDGLAEERFLSRNEAKRHDTPFTKDGEKKFIQDKLHAASGNELKFYDVAANKAKYRKLARKHAKEMLAAYKAA